MTEDQLNENLALWIGGCTNGTVYPILRKNLHDVEFWIGKDFIIYAGLDNKIIRSQNEPDKLCYELIDHSLLHTVYEILHKRATAKPYDDIRLSESAARKKNLTAKQQEDVRKYREAMSRK